MWKRVAILMTLLCSSASAERNNGIWVDLHSAPIVLFDDATQAGVLYGVGGGYVLGPSKSFSLGLELDGMTTFPERTRLDRGAVFATITMWLGDRVSLAFGAGTPVGPEAIGEGFAGFLRGGYALHTWSKSALVLALDLNEDTTAGPQLGALIGISIFTGDKTINLWNPN